jgi:2-C-methyl-D-erythritol 4-phosphate cytidylyltransferase/2-C-methyl-D-erythritol 2,4-cyclodiphosphate synthase
MFISAIVPAAGVGKRLLNKNEKKPKQFWPLGEKMIMEHVICALEASPFINEIIICCDARYEKIIRSQIIAKQKIKKIAAIVRGGLERADTVREGLRAVSKNATHILVQDSVRPFLTSNLIGRMVESLASCDGVIAASPVAATIKKVVKGNISGTVDRTHLWEAETPQLFKRDILYSAYKKLKTKASRFTDEASLVEEIGGSVKVVDSETCNIKITTRADYELAQKMVEERMVSVGFGYDIHRLVLDRELIIGGVKIPFPKGPLGHSDGDPLLHAIIDALLGAAALGDIGELFPDTDASYKDASSSDLLVHALSLVKKKGYRLEHLDTTIVLERPKLSPYKETIKKHLQKILSLTDHQVAVKAKTKEGLESEGSGLSVSAFATVTLSK